MTWVLWSLCLVRVSLILADCGGSPPVEPPSLFASAVRQGVLIIMFNRTSEAHVRAYRLSVLFERKTFLRELRGDYVKGARLANLLTGWAEEWANILYNGQEILGMATKPKSQGYGEWKGFKDFRLTAEQLEGFASFEPHDDDLMDLVQATLANDYKLTFTYNGQSDTYNAAATANGEKDPNKGYTMSAFAPSVYAALRLLMYKHWVLLDQNWDNVPAPQKGGMG